MREGIFGSLIITALLGFQAGLGICTAVMYSNLKQDYKELQKQNCDDVIRYEDGSLVCTIVVGAEDDVPQSKQSNRGQKGLVIYEN